MRTPSSIIHQGSVLSVLPTLPDDSVDCCVTSPPYWGLRSYLKDASPLKQHELGCEPTPDEYIDHMVLVFREIRRVLKPTGTLWLNLGDTYANNGTGGHGATGGLDKSTLASRPPAIGVCPVERRVPPGLKIKDLVGIPWRTALALQADGWWLRSEIIWHKENAFPESVLDRPTRAHEHLFLLTKNSSYFYDSEAIKEPSVTAPGPSWQERKQAGAIRGNVAAEGLVGAGTQRAVHGQGLSHNLGSTEGKRNRRTVWSINTAPFKDAHFAVFPEELVEPCIWAGSSEAGCCPTCGSPWERATFRPCEACGEAVPTQAKKCEACGHVRDWKKNRELQPEIQARDWSTPGRGAPRLPGNFKTATVSGDWIPSCDCEDEDEPTPSVIIDPFTGSGTTGAVALKSGRSFLGIELNPEYIKIAEKRLSEFIRQPRLL